MNKVILILSVLAFTRAYGQDHQQEINEHVWKPFTKAIMEQDVKTFASLHSTEMIRVERNSKNIFGLEQYRSTMESGWPQWKESLQQNKIQYTFELRFIERICNGEVAYEVGYFKNESTSPAGEKRVNYGKFHVTLRKENGYWKILVDSDSSKGASITEESFKTAMPLN
jgi:ketosteroid isomerase-like protein